MKVVDALEVAGQVPHLRRALAEQLLIRRGELRLRELLVLAAKGVLNGLSLSFSHTALTDEK